jgi:hypothetical protein
VFHFVDVRTVLTWYKSQRKSLTKGKCKCINNNQFCDDDANDFHAKLKSMQPKAISPIIHHPNNDDKSKRSLISIIASNLFSAFGLERVVNRPLRDRIVDNLPSLLISSSSVVSSSGNMTDTNANTVSHTHCVYCLCLFRSCK